MHSMRTGAPCEPNYRKSSAAWRGIIRQKTPRRAGKATATGRPAGQLNATPVPSGLGRPSCRYCTQFLSLHCTNLCKYGCYPLGRHESGAAPHPSSWKMNARERLGQMALEHDAASAFPSKPQSRTSASAYNAAVNFLARPKPYRLTDAEQRN